MLKQNQLIKQSKHITLEFPTVVNGGKTSSAKNKVNVTCINPSSRFILFIFIPSLP